MNQDPLQSRTAASLVLSGGVGLGAFQAGAVELLAATPGVDIASVSGASIGALNGAIVAGNAPEHRVARLRAFWDAIAIEAVPSAWVDPWGLMNGGALRRTRNWVNALTTGLGGSPGLFTWRGSHSGRGQGRSLYDNDVLANTLRSLVDFDRLNGGAVRLCVATTDAESGEAVFFDTARGDRIDVEHLVASSSLLPAFEPVRIGGRLLVDGGFACNLPLEAEIGPNRAGVPEPLCIAIDLFTPGGAPPVHLNRGLERSIDLMFGMQTRMRLAGFEREWALAAALGQEGAGAAPGIDLLYLSYRSGDTDAGFGKPLDLSPATLADRWRDGFAAAARAVARWSGSDGDDTPGLRVHRID